MRFVVAIVIAVAVPAAAVAQIPDPADHVYLDQNWKPDDVTAAVLQACHIAVGFWSVEKETDGTALIQASPTLSLAQKTCADTQFGQSGLTLAQ